jgi:hypothetical protein
MTDYSKMTQEDFENHLEKVLDSYNRCPSQLLSIPGVYECVSEYYNNEVLDSWAEANGLDIEDD